MFVVLGFIVAFVVAFIIAVKLLFGPSSDNVDTFATEEENGVLQEWNEDKVFAEHLIRSNMYTRINDAFNSATGKDPLIEDIDSIIKAYRQGLTTPDSFEDYIRSELSAEKDKEEKSKRSNIRYDKSDIEDGNKRYDTSEDDAGNVVYGESDLESKYADKRYDEKSAEHTTVRFADDDSSGESAETGTEDSDEAEEDGGSQENDAVYDDIITRNVKRALVIAGVVTSDENVKVAIDKLRSGAVSLQTLVSGLTRV